MLKQARDAERVVRLLLEARYALYVGYIAAGGDEAAKTNAYVRKMRKLLDKIDLHFGF